MTSHLLRTLTEYLENKPELQLDIPDHEENDQDLRKIINHSSLIAKYLPGRDYDLSEWMDETNQYICGLDIDIERDLNLVARCFPGEIGSRDTSYPRLIYTTNPKDTIISVSKDGSEFKKVQGEYFDRVEIKLL